MLKFICTFDVFAYCITLRFKVKYNCKINLGQIYIKLQFATIRGVIMSQKTAVFSLYDDRDKEIRTILTEVYHALKEKGYNPINQIVGYILSEDPTYITTYQGARSNIRKIDRDDLLQTLLKSYLAE